MEIAVRWIRERGASESASGQPTACDGDNLSTQRMQEATSEMSHE